MEYKSFEKVYSAVRNGDVEAGVVNMKTAEDLNEDELNGSLGLGPPGQDLSFHLIRLHFNRLGVSYPHERELFEVTLIST